MGVMRSRPPDSSDPGGMRQVFGEQIIIFPCGNFPAAEGVPSPVFCGSVYFQGFHNFNKDFNILCKFKMWNLLRGRVYINAPCNDAAPRNICPGRGVLSF